MLLRGREMLTRPSCLRLGRWLGFCVGVQVCAPALADPPREQVHSIRPLLIAAIERGHAMGILVGPAADAIASQFDSRAPIVVEVAAVADLATPGCRRLQVETRQEQVVDRERSTEPGRLGRALPPSPLRLQYRINFCADGKFPPAASAAGSAGSAPGKSEVDR